MWPWYRPGGQIKPPTLPETHTRRADSVQLSKVSRPWWPQALTVMPWSLRENCVTREPLLLSVLSNWITKLSSLPTRHTQTHTHTEAHRPSVTNMCTQTQTAQRSRYSFTGRYTDRYNWMNRKWVTHTKCVWAEVCSLLLCGCRGKWIAFSDTPTHARGLNAHHSKVSAFCSSPDGC